MHHQRGSPAPLFFRPVKPLSPIVAALVALVAFASHAQAAAFVPTDDAIVLERLPSRGDPALAELRRQQLELAKDARDPRRASLVAQRAIQAARASGDPRFLGQAQAALMPWWSDDQAPGYVLTLRATIKQSLHDFAGALRDLDRLLAIEPGNAQALLTRATVLTVTGRYDEARRDCTSLAPRVDALVATTCMAGVTSVTGDADHAARLLDDALATSAGPAEVRVWSQTLAGEIAVRRGDTASAEKHFVRALASDATDAYLKGAYADFLLDQRRYAAVVALLRNETRNDALLLRLALSEKQLPEQALAFARHRDELAERFEAARRRSDTLHLREEARFALEIDGDAKRALRLARENWANQREPADLRILAAAAEAGNDASARDVVAQWIAKTGYRDIALATRKGT